jgi:solute carrier family 25 carnitine/acylcarnitine transporter 20/29
MGFESGAAASRWEAPQGRRVVRIASSEEPRESHHWSHDVLDFAAGTVGGAAGIAVGHPFDTIKVRLQNDSAKAFAGPTDAFRRTLRREGVRGLFKGIEAPLISSLPIQALVFGVYGVSLRRIGQYTQDGLDPANGLPNSDLQPIWHHVAAGTMTGAVQTPMLAASDYAKILMQNQFEPTAQVKAQKGAASPKVLYTSSVDVARRVYREHGLRTTFRGTAVTLLRDITYGQYFGQYEWMKRRFIGTSEASSTRAAACALAGGISGLTAWFMIYPLDVIKTRIQSQPAASPPLRIWPTARQMAAEEPGFKAFTRGLGVTLVRSFPVNVVTFFMYETVLGCSIYLP